MMKVALIDELKAMLHAGQAGTQASHGKVLHQSAAFQIPPTHTIELLLAPNTPFTALLVTQIKCI